MSSPKKIVLVVLAAGKKIVGHDEELHADVMDSWGDNDDELGREICFQTTTHGDQEEYVCCEGIF